MNKLRASREKTKGGTRAIFWLIFIKQGRAGKKEKQLGILRTTKKTELLKAFFEGTRK